MEGHFSAIDVKLDLHRACDALGVPADQRRLLTLRYNEPTLTLAEAGRVLGWDPHRLDRVARSLQSDRSIGFALQQRLAAYKKSEKSCQVFVRETNVSAA